MDLENSTMNGYPEWTPFSGGFFSLCPLTVSEVWIGKRLNTKVVFAFVSLKMMESQIKHANPGLSEYWVY
jgi:hypothetical protein